MASIPGILSLDPEFFWKYEGMEVIGSCGDDMIAGCEWAPESDGLRVETSITNTGSAGFAIEEIRIHFLLSAKTGMENVMVQSWTMSGRVGISEATPECRSSGVIGWSNPEGNAAVVAGFLDHSTANGRFEAMWTGKDTWRVTAIVNREGTPLAPGEALSVSPIRIRTGTQISGLLERYADEVSSLMGRREKKPPESGWCSWYHFYGKETFQDVAACAEELAGLPLAASLRTIQIDDGWNRDSSENLPDAWGDWEAHADKFPEGMAAAARRIHDLGFRAGLWLAPFAVARKSRLFLEHPEWLVGERDPETGNLVPATTDSPDIFALDCTHPEALQWLRETFRRVFSEWQFDYIKIDFLHYGAKEGGVRHDPLATSVEAYRRGLEAINETAGKEKFILACGAPLLPSAGLVDGMRIGPDVGGRWLFDPGWPDWPGGNCCVRAAALASIWSQWMHGRLWQNDPDCLIARQDASRYELEALGRFERDIAAKNPGYRATPLGLTDEEAAFWTSLVWMGGGMALLSEVWSKLPADRQILIARCFPGHGREVHVLDWFKQPDVTVLVAKGGPLLIGVFNFGDTPVHPLIPVEKLELSENWTLKERWRGELLQGAGTAVAFPELPPHSGRVWEEAI